MMRYYDYDDDVGEVGALQDLISSLSSLHITLSHSPSVRPAYSRELVSEEEEEKKKKKKEKKKREVGGGVGSGGCDWIRSVFICG